MREPDGKESVTAEVASQVKIIAALLAAFALPVFLFPTLHRVHSYYSLEGGIFLLTAVSVALSALAERPRVIIGIAVMALQIITFETTYRPALAADDGARAFGAYLQAHTKPDDVLLVYGEEWSPEIPYYAHRRAVMCTTLASIETCQRVAKTVHIGATIDCRRGPCEVRLASR